MLRFTRRRTLGLMGAIATASVAWATKAKLDAMLGPAGFDHIAAALTAVLQELVEHVATTTLALSVGLVAGGLISGAARRLDTRLKSVEA